jgi:hypothetical protein
VDRKRQATLDIVNVRKERVENVNLKRPTRTRSRKEFTTYGYPRYATCSRALRGGLGMFEVYDSKFQGPAQGNPGVGCGFKQLHPRLDHM